MPGEYPLLKFYLTSEDLPPTDDTDVLAAQDVGFQQY
jgi:hypothetical protein